MMKQKCYLKGFFFIFIVILFASSNLKAQNQGLYADTIKWPNSNAITVNLRAKNFRNVFGFYGTVKWDITTLQFVSLAGNSSFGASNFSFGTAHASAQGYVTYIYTDFAANHTVADGTIIMSLKFNVINNPLSTYNNNVVYFANSPQTIEIDTAADIAGLSDLAALASPNIERHISGYVSFARPPVLTYASGNVKDSITNRPVGCTYQWTVNGSNVTGTSINSYNNAPAGSVCLSITYPNATVVNCTNAVLPIQLNSFTGKLVGNKVLLTWSTSNEVNNKGFVIEKSLDGITFNQIGFVNADNATTSQHQYNYTDDYANNAAWYRLNQVDNDGKSSYSNAVRIVSSSKDVILVYPNPTKNFVHIEGDKITCVSISNTLGKVVMQKNFDGVSATTLNIATLTSGFYLLNVKTATSTTVSKLVVE